MEIFDFRRFFFKNGHFIYCAFTLLKQMLNLWALENRIIPQVCKNLATAILEAVPQLQERTWWKEEARAIEQSKRSRGICISQYMFLSESRHSDLQRQHGFYDHFLVLYHLVTLSAWDKVEKSG